MHFSIRELAVHTGYGQNGPTKSLAVGMVAVLNMTAGGAMSRCTGLSAATDHVQSTFLTFTEVSNPDPRRKNPSGVFCTIPLSEQLL